MVKPILKQPIVPIDVLAMKLAIPLDIVKQHLLKTFFHPEVGIDYWWDTCLGASTRSNHSKLDYYWGGAID